MYALEVSQLLKRFEGADAQAAVDNVDLAIEPGLILVLLGPSGCGKTTLLRSIAGLEDPQRGTITFGDQIIFDTASGINVPTHKRDIGLVFQNYSLWPHMTVADNVAYPLRARGRPSVERDRRTKEILSVVQCQHLADRFPAMLSGGQQQRVALARALAPEPAILLLDEPLSNLDVLLRIELRAQLRAIHRAMQFTAIYVTHDQTEAFALGSRIAVMNRGRIEQIDLPEIVYSRPSTEYVAKFLGIRNMLSAARAPQLLRTFLMQLNVAESAEPSIYIRPETLNLNNAANDNRNDLIQLGSAIVVDKVNLGSACEYFIDIGGTQFVSVRSNAEVQFGTNDIVYVSTSRQECLVYSRGRLVKT